MEGQPDSEKLRIVFALGRHFMQTAKSCGLPDKMVKEVIQELTDTAASGIDQALSHLPKGFPETITTSISVGVKQRLKSLAKTDGEG